MRPDGNCSCCRPTVRGCFTDTVAVFTAVQPGRHQKFHLMGGQLPERLLPDQSALGQGPAALPCQVLPQASLPPAPSVALGPSHSNWSLAIKAYVLYAVPSQPVTQNPLLISNLSISLLLWDAYLHNSWNSCLLSSEVSLSWELLWPQGSEGSAGCHGRVSPGKQSHDK